MRWVVLLSGACATWLSLSLAQAQLAPITTASLIPSPIGIALTVGKWIWDATAKEQVYYIEVAGEGRTTEEARTVAFRVAVEQAIGSIMSSETEVHNGRITRDEIISYASGYVDRFEIVSQDASPIGVKIAMRVWVRRSALSNRLLNRSERSGEVDGARASVQLSTLNQERATGDRLVQTVLNDFPKRAFDIKLKNTELRYSTTRQGMLEIPFVLTWNRDYLTSLWTALAATSQKGSKPYATISVSPGAWFAGFGGTATYSDPVKSQLVAGAMVGTRPAVLITVRSVSNIALYRQCYRWPELDHFDGYVIREGRFVHLGSYGNHISINGGFKLDAIAQIPANPGLLANVARVDVDVVVSTACPNQ
jgi:hypothetical protein